MPTQLIGKKKGMTQIFDAKGRIIICSIILIETNYVVQIKTKDKDGYSALQLGSFSIKEKNVTKPLLKKFEKVQLKPCRHLKEVRKEDVEGYKIGQKIDVTEFKEGEYVDVIGKSKGKGFQGVMKLYGFKGGPASHGSSKFHRKGGSTGMRSTPGRCFPGGKRASRMGSDRVTVQNLKIVAVDKENNLVVVQGAIPGSVDSIIYVRSAKKKEKISGKS